MMKNLILASVIAIGCMAGTAQAATTISYAAGSGVLPAGTFVFQNFDQYAPLTQFGSSAYALDQNYAGAGARPDYGSTGNYAAVLNGGSYTVSFDPTKLFSFVIGSLDTFNTLTLKYADNSSVSYTGGAIVSDSVIDGGNQTSPETNGTVSYTVTSGSLLTGATFSSSGNSFEFDNLATAVPEPAAWGMMIVGFGLVGGVLRRRSTKVTFA